jgi:hypothetical protein
MVALMGGIAREATGDSDAIAVVGEDLLSAAYRDDEHIWVRLLNISGLRDIPVGDPIGHVDPTYHQVGPVEIEVRVPVAPQAVLCSPDREQDLELEVLVQEENGLISIPANAFRRYAFVRMERAE